VGIKNNFLSVICLGNFNPSILTPQFLSETFGIKFEKEPKFQLTPVLATVDCGDVLFLAELEKLQIVNKNLDDFRKTKIIDYFEQYLEVLKYTPIFVCGINLNTEVSVSGSAYLKNFKDKAKIFESLETNELTIDYKETISKDGREDWISYNFEFVGKDNTVFRLNFRKKDVNVAVNFNFEVKDLETDRTRIKMISRNFEYLIQRNEKILNSFFRDR